ncbi:hypothetical protein [Roseicella sp. DB1501]|uniref:hypothetical protein n=1 Tax=Roseicella sp. DB1501 TaxID=2730925 RepID=UPI0014931538|nr:hypothetical protein [Roseicella sp. DB1501]NOG73671.1 hypothetical protein [Roseicella sp. DB1501]
MVTLRITLPVDLVERVLWLSGARTVQEVVELALFNFFLNHMPAELSGKGIARRFWAQVRIRRPPARG